MNEEARAAQAEAKAAKARAKALRPWWKRKRVIIPAVLVVWIALGAAFGRKTETKKPAPTVPAAPAGVKGEAREIRDVELASCTESSGVATASLVATNSSSKRSDYSIDVAFFDADDVQVDTGVSFISNLEPGATAKDDAVGFLADGFTSPITCKITEVSRHASL